MRPIFMLWGLVVTAAVPRTVVSAQTPASAAAHRAIALFERGEYASAKTALSDASGAEASYYLGRIAIIEDRPADAARHFERAVKAEPRTARYRSWLGIALGLQARESGRFRQMLLATKAKDEFERALALDSRDLSAHEGLVQYYSIAPAVAGGSVERARTHAAAIARVSPLRGFLADGMIHERDKSYAAAEAAFTKAIRVAPDSAAPLLALGALYQRQQRWDDAFDAYERALALAGIDVSDRLIALYQFGRTGAVSGRRLAESERMLKGWLERAPSATSPRRVARTRARLGMVYAHLGQSALARAEFEAALALNAKDPDARAGLAALR